MYEHNKNTTKEKILMTAARMFSERGYDRVTTREIAKDIGINSASIYHYFSSKNEILKSLYKLYSEQRQKESPDIDELLRLAETDAPHEVLMKIEYYYDEEVRQFFDQILVTASRMVCSDPESERFIRENIFDNITRIIKPLLRRMVELGKIESFDDDVFFKVLSNYCFSAAALNNSVFRQNFAEYRTGLSYIFTMIK